MNNISLEGRFNDLDKIQKPLTKDLKGVGYRSAYIQNSTLLPIRNCGYYSFTYSLPAVFRAFIITYTGLINMASTVQYRYLVQVSDTTMLNIAEKDR